ncbi:hypothetical protein [Crossiella sp. CA198]|uniref:hypothetical protein n=1 Tax=Crossiella sp. CA198 TaxID=3455607 RepID=UPI003F8D1173
MDRLRVSLIRSMWLFLVCGLGYTTVGVHDFLAGGLSAADPAWWGAWLVEPCFAGVLITVLRWEAEMLARGVATAYKAVHRLKHLLLASTLIMNVWSALAPATGSPSAGSVFVHIVIPLVVYLVAEVIPHMQSACVQARDRLAPVAASASSASPSPVPSAVATSPVPVSAASSAGLSESMRSKLAAVHRDAAGAGRAVTAHEIAERLRVPLHYATRLLSEPPSVPS